MSKQGISKPGKILPVILSGGAGSRLWPLSRQACPKQFLPLVNEKTLIQETAQRVSGENFLPPVFMCNAAHTDMITAHMAAINCDVSALMVEPVGRNTAPCAVVASLFAIEQSGTPLVLLLPADHHIQSPQAFNDKVLQAEQAARAGHLVTFGITPDKAETGYGYIQRGGAIDDHAFTVKAFKEKPDADTAQTYMESGDYMWNAGIFLFDPHVFLSEMADHAPEILKAAKASFTNAKREGLDEVSNMYVLDKTMFAACPSESIDYAVMEKTNKAAIVPTQMGWTDIGSFTALHSLIKGDQGNAFEGDILTHGVENCHIHSDGPLVTAVGVKDLTIIVEDGRVLVLAHAAAQDVKAIVTTLKDTGRIESL